MAKILFINRYFFPDESATAQLLSDLAFDLERRGFEVLVVTSRQLLDDPNAGLSPYEEVKGVKVHRLWTSRWGRNNLLGRAADYLTFYPSAARTLFKLVQQGDVIVAKTDPPLIGAVAAFIAHIRGAFLVNWLQDLYPEVAERLNLRGITLLKWPMRKIRNWFCRSAVRNVAIGRCMRDYLISIGIPEERISVIPNWVDDERIMPKQPEANLLRTAWGLQDRFVIGYSGNLGRVHGFYGLLKAAKTLMNDPRIVFLFIGNGAKRISVENRVRQWGLDNVVFQPYQPRDILPWSLTVPDVHIVTLQNRVEGLIVPSKFYGAVASGRPVIFMGPDGCEVSKLISEYGCGYRVDLGDVNGLVEAVEELSTNEVLYKRMSSNARRVTELSTGRVRCLSEWCGLVSEYIDQPVGDSVEGRSSDVIP